MQTDIACCIKTKRGKCPVCNEYLGYMNSIELEILHLNRVSDTRLEDKKELNKIENLQLLHKDYQKTPLKIKN